MASAESRATLGQWVNLAIDVLGVEDARVVMYETMRLMSARDGGTIGEWRAALIDVAAERYPDRPLVLPLPRYN